MLILSKYDTESASAIHLKLIRLRFRLKLEYKTFQSEKGKRQTALTSVYLFILRYHKTFSSNIFILTIRWNNYLLVSN